MGARKLLLSHMAKVVKEATGEATSDPDKLPPGNMKLYSFYKPGLLAEDYVIEVEQRVTATTQSGTQTIDITNTRAPKDKGPIAPQVFTVVVPRFTIDPAIINSYYPPDGHQDEGRILPHLVLNDPHYPWEIPAGSLPNMKGKIDPQIVSTGVAGSPILEIFRSMVPWVALLVFDVDELRFNSVNDMKTFKLQGFSTDADLVKQNANGTFAMTVADYVGNIPVTSRNNYEAEGLDLTGNTDKVNVIFPQKDLIRTVIGQYFDGSTTPDLESYKYLAHVRHINTENCPDAIVQQQGIFSIVVSPRTGPVVHMTQPRSQICHLVTIEHLDSTIAGWTESPSGRVGLISLFSWIYTATPPNPVNFVTTMRHLTENQQMLRTNDTTLGQLENSTPKGDTSVKAQVGQILASRMRAGYTLSRWRTQTGEETVAFNRGPLVPISQPVNNPAALDLPDCSNTSQAYQILDPQTGLMDLTYSSAWQAGKLLAISDTNFSAALMRYRSRVHGSIASDTKMKTNGLSRKRELIASLAASVSAVRTASTGLDSEPQRFRPNDTSRSVIRLKDADAALIRKQSTKAVVEFNANAGDEIFNEFNKDGPNNSDWAIIHSWLADKLLLGGIPPQYLLPESSHLPRESLRFFYIDDFWLDCLIDGALSIANHLDGEDDVVRREIKEIFNLYLRSPVPPTTLKPQIPCYGFVIRSQLIKAMPDLKINVVWQQPDARLPVCKWTKWDEQTLLALFDRPPEELTSIILQQPTHQQRFSLGSGIDVDASGNVTVNFDPRRLFTEDPPLPPNDWPSLPHIIANDWYDVGSRALKLTRMAKELNNLLQHQKDAVGGAYSDTKPNSCEFGMELNDPCYFFEIVPPANGTPTFVPRDRQLWVKTPDSSGSGTGIDHSSRIPATGKKPSTLAVVPKPAPKADSSTAGSVSTTTPLAPALPPHLSIPTPPHKQARIQPRSETLVQAQAKAAAMVSTLKTCFDLTIFPDYKGLPVRYTQDKYDPNDYIPTLNIYYFDLIFSIRKKLNAQKSEFELLKIVIDLPVASDPNMTTEALLSPDYDGPGLRMLSNQRFIPFLYHDIPDAPMHIELIPRSADDAYALKINDRKSTELGFRLAEANISRVKVTTPVDIVGQRLRQDRGKVIITMTEYYQTPAAPGGEPVSSRYTLIKWDTQDDKDQDDAAQA